MRHFANESEARVLYWQNVAFAKILPDNHFVTLMLKTSLKVGRLAADDALIDV